VQQLPSLGERVDYRDERGSASVWYAGPRAIRVETEGFIDAPVATQAFGAIARLFDTLPDDQPRFAFMDHRGVTGVSWANFVASFRWHLRERHGQLVVHMLGAELPGFLRFILRASHPILARAYEYHPTIEGFEAALARALTPE